MGDGAQQVVEAQKTVASACGGPVSFGQFLDHPSFSYVWDHIPALVVMSVMGVIFVFLKKVTQDVMDRPIKAVVKQITRFISFIFGRSNKASQPSSINHPTAMKPINLFWALFQTQLVIMICTIFIKDVNISASNWVYSSMFSPVNAFIMKALQSKIYTKLFRDRAFLNDFFYANFCLLVSGVAVCLMLLCMFPFIYILDPIHRLVWKIL